MFSKCKKTFYKIFCMLHCHFNFVVISSRSLYIFVINLNYVDVRVQNKSKTYSMPRLNVVTSCVSLSRLVSETVKNTFISIV